MPEIVLDRTVTVLSFGLEGMTLIDFTALATAYRVAFNFNIVLGFDFGIVTLNDPLTAEAVAW